MKQETVLIIDMMNMYVRNFSAFAVTNDNGELVSGVYGSLASIRSSVEKFNPDHVVIAWEGEKSSERRRRTMADYKEGRSFTGLNRRHFDTVDEDEKESFRRQLILLKECLDYLPVTQIAVKYLEADDVIAYMCKKILGNSYKKIIVSNDRDYLQLIDEDVSVFRPVKTKQNPQGELIDLEWMLSKEECFPPNYVLVKSICGDKSDNISGLSGVGEKTVKKDFPFLSESKEYSLQDIISFSKKQKNNKYQKYVKSETQLKDNVDVVQLIDPNISNKSVDTIINILTKGNIKFNPFKFRIKLLSEGISPNNIENWISSFATLKTNQFTIY